MDLPDLNSSSGLHLIAYRWPTGFIDFVSSLPIKACIEGTLATSCARGTFVHPVPYLNANHSALIPNVTFRDVLTSGCPLYDFERKAPIYVYAVSPKRLVVDHPAMERDWRAGARSTAMGSPGEPW
jgi:diadenosine tetraphosphatase ApaH/serine/threonine PP2A family protein phosphatase